MSTFIDWARKHTGFLVLLIAISLLIGVGIVSAPYVAGSLDQITDFVRSFGPWAIVIFGVIYLFLSVLGVSTIVLTILAGVLFGVLLGIVVVVAAATGAAIIAFMASRYFSHKLLNHDKPLDNRFMKMLTRHAADNGFTTVAILRLSFLPYIPLSYACGLVSELRFKDYFWATLVTNLFGSTVFILVGASIQRSLVLFAGALGLVIVYFLVSRRIQAKNNI